MQTLRTSGAFVAVTLGVVAMAGQIASAQVNGSLWENDASGTALTVPVGTPNVTFTTPGIHFASGPLYTIGEFLNSGSGSTILTGAGELGHTLDNVHITLTGTIFLNAGINSFQIRHDDGLVLKIAGLGTPLSAPGPTAPTLTPFDVNNTMGAGTFSYTLDYNECCGAPAALDWLTPAGVPIGSGPDVPDSAQTIVLLGLAAAGLMGCRKFVPARA